MFQLIPIEAILAKPSPAQPSQSELSQVQPSKWIKPSADFNPAEPRKDVPSPVRPNSANLGPTQPSPADFSHFQPKLAELNLADSTLAEHSLFQPSQVYFS